MKYLVDSNIIIYHLNNIHVATDFLSQNYQQIAISQITYVEVLSFSFTNKEESKVKILLSQFKILDVDQVVSKQAVKNRKLKKIKLPDNLIVSTAIVHGLSIVTRNVKDFKDFDIEVINIFDS